MRGLNRIATPLFMALASMFMGQAHADVKPPTDAGQVLKEIERDLEVKPVPRLPEVEAPAAVDEDQGPKVVIQQFQFEGGRSLTEADLRAALATLTNREITITELKSAPVLFLRFIVKKACWRQQRYLIKTSRKVW